MQIVADIRKNPVQNNVPFFSGGFNADKPQIFVFDGKQISFRFAVDAVDCMYYFIQVMHVA